MDNFSFGLAMTVVGMGGTVLSLLALTLFTRALKRLFPFKAQADGGQRAAKP